MRWLKPRTNNLRDSLRKIRACTARGQSLVEFAFALIPFILISFGTIEFGWAVYSYNTINNAADEGARRGMVLNRPGTQYALSGNSEAFSPYTNPTCNKDTIVGTVGCNLGMLPASEVRVFLDVPNAPYTAGVNIVGYNTVSVEVRYSYQPIIAYPIKSAFTMGAKSQMITQ